MWMPLGWVSASGAGGSTASFELISTTLISINTPSVTFNLSAAQQSAYKHLQLRVVAQSTWTGTARAGVRVTFNGDEASNYSWHELFGDGSAASSQNAINDTGIMIPDIPYLLLNNSVFGVSVADILDAQSTSKNKTIRALGGHTGSGATSHIGLGSGAWYSTAAISSITLKPITYNFISGTRLSLYGVRG